MKKLKIIFTIIILLGAYISNAQVSIATDGSTPDPSAMLDVKSSDKGFLPPRMTETERDAIVAPATGLWIFNVTNNCMEYYNSTKWVSTCNFGIVAPATYSIGTGGAATNFISYGIYTDGVALDAGNYVTFEATATTGGSWAITTDVVNGYSFSGNGTFAAAGTYTVTLLGSGTPLLLQTDNFTATGDYSGGSCTFDVLVASSNLAPVASNVAFTGTMNVGETLTGSYDYTDNESDLEGASTYVWYRADDASGTNQAAIAGATALTYDLVVADDGKFIAFEVTPVALTGTSPGTAALSSYQGVLNLAPVASNAAFTGTLNVGETLTGSYDYADNEGDLEGASTYVWYRADDASGTNQAAIAGATALTYDLVAADDGKFIAFEVTPVALTGTSPGTAVVSSYQGVLNLAPVASNVAFTGTLNVGETLTGSYDYTDNEGDLEGASTYVWYRADDASGTNQAAIAGATALTYDLVAADDSKFIAFEVTPVALTGTSPGTAVVSAYQGAVITPNLAPVASNVTFSGTMNMGETLTGSYDYADNEGDLEGASTYIWYRADDASGTNQAAIAGATALTYDLVAADDGKFIAFEVTPVALTGTTTGTAVVSNYQEVLNLAPVASNAAFTGTLNVGETLTGSYDYADNEGDLEGTSTYVWYRADDASGTNQAAIAGATALSYDLVAADDGKFIAFEVTPVALTGTTTGTAVVSAFQGAVITPNLAPVASNAAFTGTLNVGETLTGSYDYADNEGDLEGTSTYVWYRADDASGTNQAAIAGATALTYDLVGADDGKFIAFEVTPVALTGTTTGTAVVTAYQEVLNLAPVAGNVTFTGTLKVAETLTESYDYTDNEGDLEGTSIYQWYRADDNSGTNEVTISGANSLTYVLVSSDEGKYIAFEVTPVAQSGTSPGSTVKSIYSGVVLTNIISMTTCGNTVIYNEVTGATGRVWLDKNIGASQVATSYSDYLAYGSKYQWGRSSDGHECVTYTSSTAGTADNGTTYTLSTTDNPGHNLFIIASQSPNDWRSPQNNNLWQGQLGINNPCPTGFRLPTNDEWNLEEATFSPNNFTGAFNSPLKLPCGGLRSYNNGTVYVYNNKGYYSSSTSLISNGIYLMRYLYIYSSVSVKSDKKGNGYSVRCIKDEISGGYNIGSGSSCNNTVVNGVAFQGVSVNTTALSVDIEVNVTALGSYYIATNTVNGYNLIANGIFTTTGIQTVSLLGSGTPIAVQTDNFNVSTVIGGSGSCTFSVMVEAPISTTNCGSTQIYIPVVNSSTGDVWLDRNLGASQVPSAYNDQNGYGSLYQWGRLSDGHECTNYTNSTTGYLNNTPVGTLSSSDNPGHSAKIYNNSSPYDWRNPQNDNLWQGVSGVNNPCPSGYRIPTNTELENERLTWSANKYTGAFASPLKLPAAGLHSNSAYGQALLGEGGSIHLWSSTVTGNNSYELYVTYNNAYLSSSRRARSESVRCIKD